MNVLKAVLSTIAGCAAALIAYSALYVRGDVSGVMAYLHARAALRRLRAAGPDDQVSAAQTRLHELGQQVGDPAFAAQLLPVALLVGAVIGAGIWWVFTRRQEAAPRSDIQERMVLRLAHRRGGQFTLDDLTTGSPLSADQARAATAHLLALGRLNREGDTFRLAGR